MQQDYLAAAMQMEPRRYDKAYNLAHIQALAQEIKTRHPAVRLMVFPELITTGYEQSQELLALAEPAKGPSFLHISALCKALRCCIVYGFAEAADAGVYNAAAFVDDQGNLCGVYRKVHLFSEEQAWFLAGDSFPVFPTPLGNAGLMICWDLSFPESARSLALRGADVLISCSAWEAPYEQNFSLATRMRAYENCLPHIAANRTGTEGKDTFIGHSAIYAAGGDLPARCAHAREDAATALITPAAYAAIRKNDYPFLESRIVHAYANADC